MLLSGCLYYERKRKNHIFPAINGRLSLFVILFFLVSLLNSYCQQNVGIGTASPDNSAVMDLVSNSMGFLVPRMTTANRDGIVSPATGLLIYNTTNNRFEYNAGTPGSPNWLAMLSATLPAGTNNQTLRYNGASTAWEASSVLVNNGTNIGIGASAPSQKLEVQGNLLLSNAGAASELRLAEPSASGTDYTAFKAATQTGNITYTLPATPGAAGDYLLNSGGGNLTWLNPFAGIGITSVIKASVWMNPPNLSRHECYDYDVAVTGARAGSTVLVSPVTDLKVGAKFYYGIAYAYVPSDDVVRVRLFCTDDNIDLPNTQFYITVFR